MDISKSSGATPGTSTFTTRVSSVSDFARMGIAYDIPGKQIDGMEVLTVYEEFKEAVGTAKAGTPVFLEAKTYRYRGHSMSDPATYRTRDEVDTFRRQDPIVILRAYMEERNLVSDDQYEEMDREARKIADDAAEFAESSDEPALETLYEDVLA